MRRIYRMRSSVTITIRCTEKEKDMIQKKADKAGMTISQYMKRSAVNSRTRIRRVNEDMVRHLVEIQNDVTALEREQNEESRKNRIGEIQEAVDELWKLLK